MSHNLHFIRVTATSGEEACDIAESFISDWGTDNNWRAMCGAVSQDNEVFDNNDAYGGGRFKPSEFECTSIEHINEIVNKWMQETLYGNTAKELIESGKSIYDFNTHELWSLKKYAEHLYNVRSFKGDDNDKKFDALTDYYAPYEYDECGVTDAENGDEGKTWIVFCDMYS